MDSTEERNTLPNETILGDRVVSNGHFASQGMVLIQGRHQGSMDCETIVVTRKGILEGDTQGGSLEVWGTLGGFAQVRRALCKKSSTLSGFIMAWGIALEPGATVEGGFAFPYQAEEKDETQTSD